MNKYKLIETVEKNDKTIIYIWHPGIIPDNIPVQQVYGFSVTKEKLVCLVRDNDEDFFTPPGGGVEQEEKPLEALQREFQEEAQFTPNNIQLLGSLEVINDSADSEIQRHNLQVRYVCGVGNLDEFVSNRGGFETCERIFIYYKDLPKYVRYIPKYTSGKIQYEMLCDYIEGKIKL